MESIHVGLVVSAFLVLTFSILFSYEARKGERVFEFARTRADFYVLKMAYGTRRLLRFVERDTVRQIAHYLFHRLLNRVLHAIRWAEERLRKIMHVNKKLAKNAERESATRTKLEELTLHKVATTLTESEKKKRKDKSLRGH